MDFVVIVKEPKTAKAKAPYAGSSSGAAEKAFRKAAAADKLEVIELWRHERNGTARRLSVVDNVANHKQQEKRKAELAAEKKKAEAKAALAEKAEAQKLEDAKLLLESKGFDVKAAK